MIEEWNCGGVGAKGRNEEGVGMERRREEEGRGREKAITTIPMSFQPERSVSSIINTVLRTADKSALERNGLTG